MNQRRRLYQETSPLEFLLLRQQLGLERYRKTMPRAAEKRELLLRLALQSIAEKERDDYIPLGYRHRRVKI
jgi:hypothetical protein